VTWNNTTNQVTPADGVDVRMRRHLATLLGERATRPEQRNTREDAGRYLAAIASTATTFVAASWRAERRRRMFVDRHAGGAQVSRLPRTDGACRTVQSSLGSNGSSMQNQLLEVVLGIAKPWYVRGVDFDAARKVLTIGIDFVAGSRFPAPGVEAVHHAA